jgi:hypothetical protein
MSLIGSVFSATQGRYINGQDIGLKGAQSLNLDSQKSLNVAVEKGLNALCESTGVVCWLMKNWKYVLGGVLFIWLYPKMK